jgi:hypothetical protein
MVEEERVQGQITWIFGDDLTVVHDYLGDAR